MRARHLQALGAIAVAGAVLRFATLGVQSYWLDEAATVDLLRHGFGSMISGVVSGESTPPLYYAIAWLWAKVFGTGEAGLRALSAVFGTATIPLAYLLGRRVAGRATGLVAAALCAFNPLLVWYSQEARSYALLVFLSGLTLLAMLAALERPSARPFAWWGFACAAALATHYFAGFLIAAEAAWILWRTSARRRATVAIAAVALVAAALLPIALHQRSTGAARFISGSSILERSAEIPKQFVAGYHGLLEKPLTGVAALIVVYAVLRLIAAARADERRRALVFAGLGVAAVLAPLILALIGPDYLIVRNVLPAWLPLAVALAAGLAAPGAQRNGAIAAAALCLIGLAMVVAVASDQRYQRDDWRDAARALGQVTQIRAIIVTPASGRVPLLLYLHDAHSIPDKGIDVKELDYVGLAPRLPGQAAHPRRPPALALPNFGEFARKEGETYTVIREGTMRPLHVGPTVGLSPLDGRPAIALYQQP